MQQTGHLLEELIAGGVPAGIVHELELIEIEVEQHVAAGRVLAHALDRGGEPVLEFPAVDQAGEGVVARLVVQRAVQPALLADVVKHHHGADEIARPVADRRRRILDGDLPALAAHLHDVLREPEHPAFAQAAHDRILPRLVRALLDHGEDRLDQLPFGLAPFPAGEAFRDRIHVVDAAERVGGDHRIADRLERDLGALLRLEHAGFCLLARGDVGDRALEARDAALLVAHHAAVVDHHEHGAVLAAQDGLGVAHFAALLHAPQIGVAVGGVPVERGRRLAADFLRGIEPEHLHEGGIHGEQAPVARGLVHPFHDALEQAAELRLAAAQRILGGAPLDGDPGDLGHARDQFLIARRGQPGLAPVDGDGADHPFVRGDDGRGPGGAQPRLEGRFAPVFPARIGADVGHHHGLGKVCRRGAGAEPGADRNAVHGRDEGARQARSGTDGEHEPVGLEQAHGAEAVQHHPLEHLGDRVEHRRQRRIRGDLLEDPPFARGDGLGALALGDVDDARADQAPVRARQAHEAHLAGQSLALGIAVQPFEHRRLPGERGVDVAARHAERGRAVRLQRRTDPFRAAAEQPLAVHLEEPAGIVVDVDELVPVDVEDDDHLGRMLDQRAVARLALADQLFREMPLGGVADAQDIAVAPVEAGLADVQLDGDPGAALGDTPGLMRGEIDVGVIDAGGPAFEEPGGGIRIHLRQQQVEGAAEDLGLRVAEDALGRGVESLDVRGLVDRDDGVLDVVEDGLQMRCRLLANLARERLGLVGHQLHGAHDAAPLRLDAVVVGAHRREEGVELQLAAAVAPRLADLPLEQAVHGLRLGRWFAADCGRVIA